MSMIVMIELKNITYTIKFSFKYCVYKKTRKLNLINTFNKIDSSFTLIPENKKLSNQN